MFLSYRGIFPCSSGMLLARQFLKSALTSPSQVLFNYVGSWILSSAILKCGVYFSWGIFSVVCNYGNKTFLGRVTKSIFDVRDDLVMYFFYLFPFFFVYVCLYYSWELPGFIFLCSISHISVAGICLIILQIFSSRWINFNLS